MKSNDLEAIQNVADSIASDVLSTQSHPNFINKYQPKWYFHPSIFFQLGIILLSFASILSFLFIEFRLGAHTANQFTGIIQALFVFCTFLGITSFVTGILCVFHFVYKTKDIVLHRLSKSLINLKTFALYSIVVANSALTLVPLVIYSPLTKGNVGLSPFAFPPQDELQEIRVEFLAKLLIFSSASIVILTIILLVLSLPLLIKQQLGTSQGIHSSIFWFELSFRMLVILLLVTESVLHLWGYVDPTNYSQVRIQVADFDLLLLGPIALFLLLFLVTGQFHDSSFILNNLERWKTRLLLSIAPTSLFIILPIVLVNT